MTWKIWQKPVLLFAKLRIIMHCVGTHHVQLATNGWSIRNQRSPAGQLWHRLLLGEWPIQWSIVTTMPWWRHKWRHFPRYWPFVRGTTGHRWIPQQRPVTRNFDVFLDLCLNTNGWANNWEAGDLRGHSPYCGVTVIRKLIAITGMFGDSVLSESDCTPYGIPTTKSIPRLVIFANDEFSLNVHDWLK